jgi:multiple sugar transport system substrate-binding protein
MTGAWAIQDVEDVSFKWDVVVFPKQKQSATLLGTENYAISSSSKHKQEAWELMRFLLSAKSQEFMAEKLDKQPSMLSVLHGSYINAPVDYNRKAFVDSLDFGQMAPNIPQYNEVSHYWQEQLDSIWIGDAKVKEGLAEAEREMNKLLAEEAP